MFRRLLILAAVMAVAAGAFAWPAQAAPVTGSFSINMDIYCELCTKIDRVYVHFYADLNLSLSISGVELNSLSHFTFAGLKVQLLEFKGTVGPMSFYNALVFSTDICETDFFGVGGYSACAGNWFTDSLTLRKKIAEVTLSIAGLTLGLRALFANLGTATVPSFQTGLVLILQGQTVSGITVRSETWVGATPGLECFSNVDVTPPSDMYCQIYLDKGMTFPGFQPTWEELRLTGLRLAGVTHNIRIVFNLTGSSLSPGGLPITSTASQPSFVEITSSARVEPLRLTIASRARFRPGLVFEGWRLNFSFNIGEMSAGMFLYINPTLLGSFHVRTSMLTLSYDPPGVSVTNSVVFCQRDMATGIDGVASFFGIVGLGTADCHRRTMINYIGARTEIGDLTVYGAARFVGGLLREWDKASFGAVWSVAGVSFDLFARWSPDWLDRLSVEIAVKF